MPLSATVENDLESLHRALRDRVPLPDDAVYVKSVDQRPEADAIDELSREIGWQDGGGVCLITGQRGTGKSTELHRLQNVLDANGASVFYVDMSEYLLSTKEIEISDFLMAVTGAFSEKLEERFGKTPGDRGDRERLVHFLNTEVQPDSVTTTLDAVSIKASLKDDPPFKRRLQQASRGHVARLVQDAHAFVAEAVEFVRERERDSDRKVVLIVDSVERIRGVGSEAMEVHDSVRELFVGHAQHLMLPSLHVVYSIPPYLSVLAAGAGGLLGGAVPSRLVSVHTVEHHSGDPDPKGLAVMREVITRRHPGWGSPIEEAALDRLAVSSGMPPIIPPSCSAISPMCPYSPLSGKPAPRRRRFAARSAGFPVVPAPPRIESACA